MERGNNTECRAQRTKTSGQKVVSKELHWLRIYQTGFSSLLRTSCLVLVALIVFCVFSPEKACGTSGITAGKENIALLPFENFTEDAAVVKFLMPKVRSSLEEKGFTVIDEARVEEFLLKERIRTTGCIGREAAGKMEQELGVQGIVIGSVNSFSNGENPIVGLSARIVRAADCAILWADNAAFTGEDFTTILELGTIRDIGQLTDRVLDVLFASLTAYPQSESEEKRYKIAVIPFKNDSRKEDAGIIASYLFLSALSKNGMFDPVEFGEVRRFMIENRVRGKGELDYMNTDTLAEMTGVDAILVGTVESYSEGKGNMPPEASISARLIDARENRILWCNSYEYQGDDGVAILDWGRIRSAENVANKIVSKIVENLENVRWQ
ncbi:MAG: CsgG/HfaB family protein [Nitrospirota bacterium]